MHRFRGIKARFWIPQDQTTPKIEPINPNEQNWIDVHLDAAKEMAALYSPYDRGKPLYPDVLDRIYAGWWNSPQRRDMNPNHVINAVGIGFGQFMVDYRDYEWVIATDRHGSELAIHSQPGDNLTYPTNLVSKRYERGETMFLSDIELTFRQVKNLIRQSLN